MKILVTGNRGFIGSNLKFAYQGWDLEDGLDIFEDDFEDAVIKSDVIIHLAALTNVEGSKKHPKDFYIVNVLGTARIVYLCMKYNKKLIYPSTLHVAYPERSPYADSKRIAEDIVKMARGFIPVVILRLFNVFGPGMNNNSGSVINLFLKSKKIEVWGTGNAKRDYIHVSDVASIITAALDKQWNNHIIDVGTGVGHSLKETAHLFAKYRNKKADFLPGKKEIKWPIADTTILKKLYKKRIDTNLEQDIKELVEDYASH